MLAAPYVLCQELNLKRRLHDEETQTLDDERRQLLETKRTLGARVDELVTLLKQKQLEQEAEQQVRARIRTILQIFQEILSELSIILVHWVYCLFVLVVRCVLARCLMRSCSLLDAFLLVVRCVLVCYLPHSMFS